ncbi:hypothetical protein JCM10908_003223 [Rhodotorula pacifica]|uniref:uncharacterized protein n=1 Tax=Rhodotorula pacifica TaxID=1495444 RepID=UPI0031732F61
MAPRARSASCSTPPKSPIQLDDDDNGHLEPYDSPHVDPVHGTPAASPPLVPPRRKRSLTANSLDKKAQVDALVAAVQQPSDRALPLELPATGIGLFTPPTTVSILAPPVTVAAPPTAIRTSIYPISSAGIRDSPSVHPLAYGLPFLSPLPPFDLASPSSAFDFASPGYAPLPPSSSSSSSSSSAASTTAVAPFALSPSPYASTEAAAYPLPTLYYPISAVEASHALDQQQQHPVQYLGCYPLPEPYLPSPPVLQNDLSLRRPVGAPPPAPGPQAIGIGLGAIGQPWSPPPIAPTQARLPSGFTYPISSSPRGLTMPSSGLSARVPVPPAAAAASPPPTSAIRSKAVPTPGKHADVVVTTTSGRHVHGHGHPNWSVLRQQIQAGEHPRSRGTCKFFNPQTGFGYIIDDRAEELATDVFVHFTGIEQSRGFRCLSPGERVEYILTQNSAGRVQALKVVGENGAQLLGLADPVQANRVRDAARRLSPTIDSGGSSDSSSSPSSLTGARPRKPRVVPIPPSKLVAPILATNALGLVPAAVASEQRV